MIDLRPKCNYCGARARLARGSELYPAQLAFADKLFWRCDACDAHVGCHGRSCNPMGSLANAPLRLARRRAHAEFDVVWKSGRKSRADAYAWLAKKLGMAESECHIGRFDIEQCQRVVQLMRADDFK